MTLGAMMICACFLVPEAHTWAILRTNERATIVEAEPPMRPSPQQSLTIAIFASASPTLGSRQRTSISPDAAAIADFRKRVDEYVALRKPLVSAVGELDETKSQAEIAACATKLAEAIRVARANVRPGDIFTPAVAGVFRTVIREEYGRRSAPVRNSRQDTQDELPNFTPQVNALYPTTFPLATFPPTLLRVLPPLPEEVEYRIVTKYLILRDIEANVIVDVLPNAIP